MAGPVFGVRQYLVSVNDGSYAVAASIVRRHTRRANVIDQLHKATTRMI